MNRDAYLQKTSFVLLGLLALVALVLLLAVAAPSLTGAASQRPITAGEAAPDGVIVDPYAGIHPADRKFFSDGYAVNRSAAHNAYSPSNVHPADRKFFDSAHCWTVPCGISAGSD